MRAHKKHWFYWAPRILGFIFAALISVFAIDVLGEGNGLFETLFSLIIHLIPSLAIIVILVISWRKEWIGAILFMAVGIFYFFYSDEQISWVTSIVLTVTPVTVSLLFILSRLFKRTLKTRIKRS
jgi:hypothetical protein